MSTFYNVHAPDFVPGGPPPSEVPGAQGQGQESQDQHPHASRQQRRVRGRGWGWGWGRGRGRRRNHQHHEDTAQRQVEQQEHLIDNKLTAISNQISVIMDTIAGGQPARDPAPADDQPNAEVARFDDPSGRHSPTPPTTQQDTTGYPQDWALEAELPVDMSDAGFDRSLVLDLLDRWCTLADEQSQNNDIRGGDGNLSSSSNDSNGVNHDNAVAGSPRGPPVIEAVASATAAPPSLALTPETLRLIESTYSLLERNLLESRRRVHALRLAAAQQSSLLANTASVGDIADELETAIDQVLDCLAIQEVEMTPLPGSSRLVGTSEETIPRFSRATASNVSITAGSSASASGSSSSSLDDRRMCTPCTPYCSPPGGIGRNNDGFPPRRAYATPTPTPTRVAATRPRYGSVNNNSDHNNNDDDDDWTYIRSDPDWSMF